ncbi:hypothetical protein MRS76_12935 [Rhizobiaceae bacterium n13]|uniref:Uncharacterized protein n=1 Tax=Ferirhizobium litorale TaxID=2927786 RepID=A0AAE3QHF1_9HYPH|nr:hypothetical protein [Fererhizobium litorale]MDI7862862.1 hypothetical protein [Fererhizobium litorale]MDI7923948.1 hypothetical protein [Fererhizobium litorale]
MSHSIQRAPVRTIKIWNIAIAIVNLLNTSNGNVQESPFIPPDRPADVGMARRSLVGRSILL